MNIQEWIEEDRRLLDEWQTWGRFNFESLIPSHRERAEKMFVDLTTHRKQFTAFELDLDATVKFVSRSKKGTAQIVIVRHISHRGRTVKRSFTKHVPFEMPTPKVHKLIKAA
jgi:hypothetical protein